MTDPAPTTDPTSATTTPAHRYTAALAGTIETRWQDHWDAHQTFHQPNPGDPTFDPAKPKFYCLDMFPYPSGAGLHVGHPEGYTATDIISRYKRMTGHNVLHPMGWDAFGLPAEQYAIQTGVHPEVTTAAAIDNFRRQLKRFGFSYDWSREFATIDPAYYKWTQWIWLQAYESWFDTEATSAEGITGKARPIAELIELLESERALIGPSGNLTRITKAAHATEALTGTTPGARTWFSLTAQEQRDFIDSHRLAYLGQQTVNWCPKLGTALANEEVIDGRSERGGHPVLRKPLRQWMFRITAYGDRLLHALPQLDWPESTRTMQREWIGRSEGAEADFAITLPPEWQDNTGQDNPAILDALSADGSPGALRVFTTRPDTIFGATYMVVAPEHPLVDAVLSNPPADTDIETLSAYVTAARNRSDVDRQADSKTKTGVDTCIRAINPATGQPIPIWTADYVLMGYGTGAIMAVPAHDERDFDFATTFNLPIKDVVYPRATLAMKFFAHHATADEQRDNVWQQRLADLMGYITSFNVGPDGFTNALERIRTNRSAVTANSSSDQDKSTDLAGKSLRGSIASQWLDTFKDIDLHSFKDLANRTADGTMHLHAESAFIGPGIAVNSSNADISLDGLPTDQAKERMIEWLESTGLGNRHINFKLRDWLFSRQRYWGEPFPIVFDQAGNHYAVAPTALPVTLPPLKDYTPTESDTPTPLLGKATDWVNTTAGEAGVPPHILPPETPVTRETNTMPGWAGSCWYYLRYTDPHNENHLTSTDANQYWLGQTETNPLGGTDLYIGGSEHAVLHLLYARFWHKLLFDLGHVATPEPFAKLFHQGLILSYGYTRPDKSLVPVDQVMLATDPDRDLTIPDATLDDDTLTFVERENNQPVQRIICKMSKSLKNVVNPDDIIEEYGADAFRLYEMYIGPLEAAQPWRTNDLVGLYRFLQRTWRLLINESTGQLKLADTPHDNLDKQLHRMTDKVAADIERLSFNTAIAAMIEFVNAATTSIKGDTIAGGALTGIQASHFIRILSPFVPHLAEELWHRLGNDGDESGTCSLADWPTVNPALLKDDEIEVPVQIMGKVKHRLMVPADADAKDLEQLAMADAKVQQLIAGKTVRKVVAVPGRMINIVAN